MTVVGIGASAGGLKALQSFFDALTNDTGMAYVVITHLHPWHESHLPEILQSHTHMPVTQVNRLVDVERDHVYVIPPNRRMIMADSKLDIAEFDEQAEHPIAAETTETDDPKGHQLVTRLEAEVLRLREQLQITVEEYESSDEEMKAANEELQTVNNEMKGKLDEISRGKDELQNLLGAMEIPTLFLDRELTIQRYSPSMQELFNIRPVDHNRPITHLTHRLLYQEFTEDAEQVIRGLMPLEREVQAKHGKWYMVRLQPYRTADDRIEGLVITFVDITKLKAAEQAQREMAAKLEERVRSQTRDLDDINRRLSQARDLFFRLFHVNPIPTSISRLEDGSFIDVNDAYLDFCGLGRADVINHTSEEL